MTAKQVQIRRDTATNLNAATPASGEFGYDTTNKRIVVGDGSTAGGIKIPTASDLQKQSFTFGTVGGTANAITLTHSPVVSAYTNGLYLSFKAASANTGATTVNVDGLGVKNIYKVYNGALTALSSGDIISGAIYGLFYDGTQFQIDGVIPTVTPSGLVLLDTQTAASSASISFGSSIITSTYDEYVIELEDLFCSTTANALNIETSTDNGSTFKTALNIFEQISTTAVSVSTTSSTSIKLIDSSPISGGTLANCAIHGTIKIYNSNNSSFRGIIANCQVGGSSGRAAGRSNASINAGSGTRLNNIKISYDSGNISSGTIRIYGISK